MSQRPRSSSLPKVLSATTCKRVSPELPPDVSHRSFTSPPAFSHCSMAATLPSHAATMIAAGNTIDKLYNLRRTDTN